MKRARVRRFIIEMEARGDALAGEAWYKGRLDFAAGNQRAGKSTFLAGERLVENFFERIALFDAGQFSGLRIDDEEGIQARCHRRALKIWPKECSNPTALKEPAILAEEAGPVPGANLGRRS